MGNSGYYAFVGTNSVRGSLGIYSIYINAETLEPSLVSTHQVYNTGALELSGDCLYAASEGMTFKGLADGGIYAYNFDKGGLLTEIGAQQSYGQRTCAISIDSKRKNAYGANFYKGTFAKWPLDVNGVPQKAEYVIAPPDIPGAFLALHCVKAIGSDYVAVISITECALVVYKAKDGERVTSFTFPDNPFCRYLEVSDDYIYALMQDPNDVYVFKNNLDKDGTIELIQKVKTQRETLKHYGSTTIRVTPNGKLMMVATRSNSTISVFRIQEDGKLELANIVKLPGLTPRDFGVSSDGKFIVSCLQLSNEVSIHEIDYENADLKDTGYKLSIPSPASIAITGLV